MQISSHKRLIRVNLLCKLICIKNHRSAIVPNCWRFLRQQCHTCRENRRSFPRKFNFRRISVEINTDFEKLLRSSQTSVFLVHTPSNLSYRNPPIVGDRLGCISQIEIIRILPIRSATVWDVTSTMFTFVVKIPDYRGLEKSPTLKILTTSENQALLVTIRIWQHTLCHCKTYRWQQI